MERSIIESCPCVLFLLGTPQNDCNEGLLAKEVGFYVHIVNADVLKQHLHDLFNLLAVKFKCMRNPSSMNADTYNKLLQLV